MDKPWTYTPRRGFLKEAAALAAVPLATEMAATRAFAQPLGKADAGGTRRTDAATVVGRRKLGSLEVSSVGLGVQNMHRTYPTTVPWRPEMIAIIRSAFDRGVTFFDTAEAYGPFENERILGEAIAPFRDQVRITSKFGWNIDPDSGERGAGLNSRPAHVKRAVEGSLCIRDRVQPRRTARVERRRRRDRDSRRTAATGSPCLQRRRSALASMNRWTASRAAGGKYAGVLQDQLQECTS